MLFPSEEDRRSLLQWARRAIVEAVSGSQLPSDIPQRGIFGERHGVFVTLHVRGRLRGCIGVIESEQPLGESIVRCAAGAALRDPRFSPLREEELHELEIEISLLSPPSPIRPVPHHAWSQDEVRIFGFTCEVFSERLRRLGV